MPSSATVGALPEVSLWDTPDIKRQLATCNVMLFQLKSECKASAIRKLRAANAQYAPTYCCGCSLVVAMLIAAWLIRHAPIGSCSANKENKTRTNICSSWGATPGTVQPRTAYNSPAVRLKLVRGQQKKKLNVHICVNTWKLWLGINCSLLKGDTFVRKHWRWLPIEWIVRSRLQISVVKKESCHNFNIEYYKLHIPSPWSFCTSCSWGSWRSG